MARRRRAARAYQVRAYRSAATTRRILNVLPRRSTPELKCVDTTNGNGSGVVLSLNTTPLVTPLNLVQSGAGFYNRIGRRIEMKSLHLTGLIHSTGKQADQDYCRLLVVYDRQTNGALPAASDILKDYDQSGSSSTGVFSGINPDNRERFVILADYRLAMPGTSDTAPGISANHAVDPVAPTFNINRFIPLKNLQTQFQAEHNPALIGDISTGAMYLVTMGSFASTTEPWRFDAKWRLRYRDN